MRNGKADIIATTQHIASLCDGSVDKNIKYADRILIETHLRQMQERLTRLLHSVDDALIVVNDDGAIVFANNFMSHFLEYSQCSKNYRMSKMQIGATRVST